MGTHTKGVPGIGCLVVTRRDVILHVAEAWVGRDTLLSCQVASYSGGVVLELRGGDVARRVGVALGLAGVDGEEDPRDEQTWESEERGGVVRGGARTRRRGRTRWHLVLMQSMNRCGLCIL